MPRRPKSSAGKTKRPRPLKRSDATIEKWNTPEDILLDEEDEFHASRDKILLEGEIEQDMEDDEEVFALKGLDEGESEESEDEEEMQEDEPKLKPPKRKGKKQGKVEKKASRSSEEEEDEEDEDESWGRYASAYYSSNAAQIESDDEEAQELEESEARRLQAKARDGMDENDFGLNDPCDENAMQADDLAESVQAILPALPNDKISTVRHLQKNNPEAVALARDWDDSIHNLMRTRERLEKMQSKDLDSLGTIHLYYRTLITYTTNLAFYLHLRADEKYARRPEALRTHPIMGRLLTLKEGLTTLEVLDFASTDSQDESDEDIEMDVDEVGTVEKLTRAIGRLEPQELSELLEDALLYQENKIQRETPPKPPKKKRKMFKESSEPAQPIFDLVEPEFKPSKTLPKTSTKDNISDAYGEVLSLQHADAADKSARRKSLRFHTARIESASARRQGARHALGGDDDIPYHGRQKEKEARKLKEANERTKYQGGEDLDDAEPEPRWRSQNEDNGSDDNSDTDGYYDLVKKKSKERKEKKKADYEALKVAAWQNQDEDTNGPRSLTKTILTNRGLTPHRPRSSRNPRVRKREKYEKAKKKVGSQKAIYKDGLARTGGRYEGERSGISKVVKGVRLA